jgi:hypothetical protein
MKSQTNRDFLAGGAILLMFIGAFILSVTALGLMLIAVGAIAILFLSLRAIRQDT